MEKNKLGLAIADAGNAAKNFIDKSKNTSVQIIEKNQDKKIKMEDVSNIAKAVSGTVIKGATAIKENAEENRKLMELKRLKPVFPENLDQADFFMSKLVRVIDRDKKYMESDVCKGSVGFLSDKGGIQVVNIFKDSLDIYGLTFYPDADCEFYYINPTDRDNYIALDEYFSYLKMVRINELQRVAQELGAKHFKVTYKEERTQFHETKGKAQIKIKMLGGAEGEHEASEKKYSMVDVAAEMHMDGHAPQNPQLRYLIKDDNVQNLIHLRMTGGEGFHNHKISIKMSNSLGIKESDALKIDAVLKGMKVSGNATLANEVKNESRRYLEYEIDF